MQDGVLAIDVGSEQTLEIVINDVPETKSSEEILAVDLNTEQVIDVVLPEQDNIAQIDVYWQDEVTLDLDASLMYIVSGQKEIQDYVDNKSKPEIDEYIETSAKPIVAEVVDQIATPIIDEYFEETVKPSISDFAEQEMAGYAQTAAEQAVLATTQAAIATEKANEVSETAKIVDEKTQEFSQVVEVNKSEFTNFAQEKMGEFAQTAEQATADSRANVEKARIWAEGEQAEVEPLGGALSSMGAADLAYALANAPEDTPIDASGLFAMNVVKGEKGDKGDKGDAGMDGKDGKDGDKLPLQEGNAGKFLKTDGENTLWGAVDLSSKANTNLDNISSNIDYVIENYVSGVNWYQKYKSKKIIQGGLKTISATTQPNVTINFIKAFANANVTVVAIQRCNSTWVWGGVKNGSVNASSFIFQGGGNTGGDTTDGIYWIAVGQGS